VWKAAPIEKHYFEDPEARKIRYITPMMKPVLVRGPVH